MRKAELNEVQDMIYNIFVEFDRVCRKFNIKYSMEGGTLLGAVKYGDFVPWDDDIDVIMMREDYEKFLRVAQNELHDEYFLQSYNNVPEFPLNYAKLCYNGAVICDYDYSYLRNMNHGIFVDIFPIDNVEQATWRKHCTCVGVLTGARKTKLKVNIGKLPVYKRCVYGLLSLLPMKVLINLLNKTCTIYNSKTTDFKYEICNSNRKFLPLNKELYEEFEELTFRGKKFWAVKKYDEFLRSRFGNDYMDKLPAEEKRKPSHCTNIYIRE